MMDGGQCRFGVLELMVEEDAAEDAADISLSSGRGILDLIDVSLHFTSHFDITSQDAKHSLVQSISQLASHITTKTLLDSTPQRPG